MCIVLYVCCWSVWQRRVIIRMIKHGVRPYVYNETRHHIGQLGSRLDGSNIYTSQSQQLYRLFYNTFLRDEKIPENPFGCINGFHAGCCILGRWQGGKLCWILLDAVAAGLNLLYKTRGPAYTAVIYCKKRERRGQRDFRHKRFSLLYWKAPQQTVARHLLIKCTRQRRRPGAAGLCAVRSTAREQNHIAQYTNESIWRDKQEA